MKEKDILNKLLNENKITKNEYDKLLKNMNINNDDTKNDFIGEVFSSIKDDVNKMIGHISKNSDIAMDFKNISTKIKNEITQGIDKNKIKTIAKNNKIKNAKNIVPVKEQKIIHKVDKSIKILTINIPSDYITIVGTNKKCIEVTGYFVVDDINIKNVLKLKQMTNEIKLEIEKYIKYTNANVLIMLPSKSLSDINIKTSDTIYDIKKINVNKLFLDSDNSNLKLKNNKVGNIAMNIVSGDLKIDNLTCNNFNVALENSKAYVKFKSLKNIKLNINNSNITLKGIFNHGTINMKLEDMFSKFIYDKNKFQIIKKEKNLSYLRCNKNKSVNDINLECKAITSALKIY